MTTRRITGRDLAEARRYTEEDYQQMRRSLYPSAVITPCERCGRVSHEEPIDACDVPSEQTCRRRVLRAD